MPPDAHDGDGHVVWLLASAVGLSVADWIATWLLIEHTAEGTKQVVGLSEGNLRALQNPATGLLLLALGVAWRRYGSRLGDVGALGFGLTALALAIVLVGNIIEFGLWGEGPLDTQDPGAAIFFTGLLILPLAVVLVAVAAARTAWRRAGRQV